jgi:hypothetical protein
VPAPLDATLPLPTGRKYHVFLTHTWKPDEMGRENHVRVAFLNEALKSRGVITWFDSERMTGSVRHEMSDDLYASCCVLICITREYETKVNSGKKSDNCYYEFNLASNDEHLVEHLIPVVLDRSLTNPSSWARGRLSGELKRNIFIDASEDFSNTERFGKVCDAILKRIRETL